MKKSQFKYSLLLVVMLFVSALCSSGKEANYFPLGIGARWDYSIKFMSPSGIIEGNSVMRVDGIEESEAELQTGQIIKEKFFVLTTLYSGIPGMEKDLAYYRKFEDGLYMAEDSSLHMLIPKPLKIGETWKTSYKDDNIGSITIDMTIEGIETLELLDKEGGIKKYEDCLKIVGKNKKLNLTTTDYYAPNIGLVKSVVSFPRMVGVEITLLKYSKGKDVSLEIKSLQERNEGLPEEQKELKKRPMVESLEITSIETKWVEKTHQSWPPKVVLVPAVSFKIKNISEGPLNYVDMSAKFKYRDDAAEFGACSAEVIQEKALAPGEISKTILLKSSRGIEGPDLEHIKNSFFFKSKIVDVKIFAKSEESQYILLGEWEVSKKFEPIDKLSIRPIVASIQEIESEVITAGIF